MNKEQIIKTITVLATILILSVIIMLITFSLATAVFNQALIESYLSSGLLILMNIIPIILLMTFIYLISNKLWLGYSITAFAFVTMGIANKLKLKYRDDPLVFTDLKLVGESMEMSKTYDLSLSKLIILTLLGLIVIGVLLRFFFQPKIESKKLRGSLLLSLGIVSLIIFSTFYFNSDIYASIGDLEVVNKWIESEKSQSKGIVYPFVYSIKDLIVVPPEGYDPKKAQEDLDKYTYENIAEDKKINIVSLMLEAYNDFSEFEGIDLNIDVYEEFHKLQEEAIHGKLVTNVFAGNTINTERGFLTGYFNHPKYLEKVNSFPWYLKEQGYRTESIHPITGSFYNRRNVNDFMGFDKFDHYDNKFKAIQEEPLKDMQFFDYVIEGFEDSKKDKLPYFHFSVTYQNHGPYSNEKHSETEYMVRKDHYTDPEYNIMNNYLSGINQTDKALKKLFDRFRHEEEPTMIVIFGDHNPWLGYGNTVYNMLDIDLDLEGVEGFKNYYQTPYLIWGNEAAKKILNKDLVGEGKSVSPNILMSEVFDYLDWEGNQYIQFIGDMKKTIDVNHELFFKENGEFTKELTEENSEIWNSFVNLEHYYSNKFMK